MNGNEIAPLQVQTRFLHPFTFDVSALKLNELKEKFAAVELPDTRSGHRLWETPAADEVPPAEAQDAAPAHYSGVHRLYTEELSDHVAGLLFRPPPEDSSIGGLYLRVPKAVCDRLFPRKRLHAKQQTDSGSVRFETSLNVLAVELFISGLGMAVLALTLEPTHVADPGEAKAFNYWLSQRRAARRPELFILHPLDDPEKAKVIPDPAAIHPAPDPNAPLLERLGLYGCMFNLETLKDCLLEPFGANRMWPSQTRFAVYSVVRFGAAVHFGDAACREALGPLLAGLSQIEEPGHPGPPNLENLGVEAALLNTKHWAAAASQGAAHLVADEFDPPEKFDTERVQRVCSKYFVIFLLAYLQRLFLLLIERRAASDAAQIGRAGVDSACSINLPNLRSELLLFDLLAQPRLVSSREAHNRAYRLARAGLNVPGSFLDVSRAISEMESSCRLQDERRQVVLQHASQSAQEKSLASLLALQEAQKESVRNQTELLTSQKESLGEIVELQQKVEQVEVFLIAVYSIYLIHYTGAAFFTEVYVGLATIICPPIVALFAVAYVLKPAYVREKLGLLYPLTTQIKRCNVIISSLGLLALYLAIGFLAALGGHDAEEATKGDSRPKQGEVQHTDVRSSADARQMDAKTAAATAVEPKLAEVKPTAASSPVAAGEPKASAPSSIATPTPTTTPADSPAATTLPANPGR